jgi:NAD(P) transhydrogenase subunit beta
VPGGGAAALVSLLEYLRATSAGGASVGEVIAILLGLVIGSVSFSGSIIAFGKLQGLIDAKAFKYAGQQLVTGGLFAGMLVLALVLVADAGGMMSAPREIVLGLVGLIALAFGVALVMPIGGADMPVVISLLNAYTGLAGRDGRASRSATRCSSSPARLSAPRERSLTRLMSKAMNRSLGNVLFGAFGAAGTVTAGAKTDDGRSFREVSAEDAAILLGYAQSVIIVPGYGLAVAQAQHNVRELADLLEAKGIEVKYAIHPVAGRMPGHMNVLLAEANVPYEKLFDMEQINETSSARTSHW